MSPWAKRTSRPIPSISSITKDFEWNDYSSGMNTYLSNDVLKERFWRLAQDARIPTLGEYETRKGADFHSDAVGETEDQTQESTTGAADKSFNTVTRLAQPFTAGSSGRLSKVEVNLKNDASATGTIIVALYSDSSGSPGTEMARSSIAASDLDTTYAYLTARFINAPSITATTVYWIVLYVQTTGSGSYKWSSTTTATTAKTSTDSGGTWSATSYDLNFKQHYATSGSTIGLMRAEKSDGTKKTLIAHGTSISSVDDVTGALTSIKTGLNAAATYVRGVVVNDIVYYVNGIDGFRKWDFTNESQVNATNYSMIAEHKGLLFLVDKLDPNKIVFSNFAEYETFTSTDFIYVPSPKTGDPVTAIASINGILAIWTRKKKYILYGSDNATFQLDEAPATGRKGTFTQETVSSDGNFAYFLSDDGMYRFNGTSDEPISENAYEEIKTLPSKENCVVNYNNGRVRLYHTPSGEAVNTKCYVWNINFSAGSKDVIESIDTGTYVSRAVTSSGDDYALIVASSLIGQAYWQELESNDYSNLGGDLSFELRTHYHNFGTPAREKEVRYWKPRFTTQSGNYTITIQYAYDLRNNFQSQGTPNLQGSGYIWGDAGTVWGSFTWGTTPEEQEDLTIPGSYRRIAVRYVHTATRQPHRFLGHTFRVEIRSLV